MRRRSFPKRDGKLDKGRVREQYLAGPHFDWREFCVGQSYNPELRSEFPIRTWQTEWIERKTLEQQAMLAPKVLAFRNKLAQGRIDVVEQQMFTHALLRDLLNKNIQQIGMSAAPEMCSVVTEELVMLTKVDEILTKTEFQTLLMSARTSAENNADNAEHMPFVSTIAQDDPSQIEMDVQTMGVPDTHSAKEIAYELAKYFDQFDPTAHIADNSENPPDNV